MNSRKAVCLLVLIFVPLAWLCLAPFGHGPSSAVYGPRTAFRTYRAALQLRCALASMAILLMANILALSRPTYSDLDDGPRPASPDPSSIITALRC